MDFFQLIFQGSFFISLLTSFVSFVRFFFVSRHSKKYSFQKSIPSQFCSLIGAPLYLDSSCSLPFKQKIEHSIFSQRSRTKKRREQPLCVQEKNPLHDAELAHVHKKCMVSDHPQEVVEASFVKLPLQSLKTKPAWICCCAF